ncbi:hypothetical protein [Flammeovirga sp. SJP92]|uniref:hypothetical protein n=1 Tax=Flammeovirga sp. SJP92 TaxID=1775430 RepID=UPI00078991A6|nr:hypothetical protein [Flammeovirga sp. SJP92]KXX70265.1 hypothetical protein AVL50_11710 [Flammeovirga sp. SJP92]
MKADILFVVFISIFSLTAVITLLGITNVIKGIREKYLTPLFSALILEVVAAVILLFNNQDFTGENTIPELFYNETTVEKTDQASLDQNTFLDLIHKGEKLDSLLNLKNIEINKLKHEVADYTENTQKDFYYYIQQIEKIRVTCNGSINLKSGKESTQKALKIVEQILLLNGRLSQEKNTKEEIIKAFAKFKKDNNRGNISHKIYLQDVPLFIKEYLEENYELKFYISNPKIPNGVLENEKKKEES